jgi:citrate synthase
MSSKQIGTAKLSYDDKSYELPLVEGTEGERAVDISRLRADTGLVTLDPAYGNTGSCESGVTFINGEKGILHYRGYPIEEVATRARFTEVCYLLIYGERPSVEKLKSFRHQLTYHTLIHEDMKKFFEGFPRDAHPMAIMAAMFVSLSAYYPDDENDLNLNIIRALDALNLLLILHADHEQNCSTSTVRMVGSSRRTCSRPSARASARSGARCTAAPTGRDRDAQQIHEGRRRLQEVRRQAKDKTATCADGLRPPGLQELRPARQDAQEGRRRGPAKLGINDPLLDIARSSRRSR